MKHIIIYFSIISIINFFVPFIFRIVSIFKTYTSKSLFNKPFSICFNFSFTRNKTLFNKWAIVIILSKEIHSFLKKFLNLFFFITKTYKIIIFTSINIIVCTILFIIRINIFFFYTLFLIFICRNITVSSFKTTIRINFHSSPNTKRFKFMFIRIKYMILLEPFSKITFFSSFMHSSIIIFSRNKIKIIFYKLSCFCFIFINISIIFWNNVSINIIIWNIITVII